MTVSFWNVTIGVNAKSGAAAYEKLCEALKDLEYETDEYSINNREERHPTSKLFPKL
jgi:hypothetical protein